MSKVSTDSPDKDDEKTTIMRLSDTAKSDAHVAQLLTIAEHCAKHLCCRLEPGEVAEVDPTLKKETIRTLELAHGQIRNLIDETRRWSLDPTASEKESSKLIDSTLELYEAKTFTADLYNRPSTWLRPQLQRFSGVWFVWSGKYDTPQSNDLYGKGETPAEAMMAFDDAFYDAQKVEKVEEKKPEPAPEPESPAPKRTRKPKK